MCIAVAVPFLLMGDSLSRLLLGCSQNGHSDEEWDTRGERKEWFLMKSQSKYWAASEEDQGNSRNAKNSKEEYDSEEDVDKAAEAFIVKFNGKLQRQNLAQVAHEDYLARG